MATPQWTAAQQAAIDYRGNALLLSAAAGSGKTATLTQRIVALLTEPGSEAEISRMLCVTFTRAAAAELRERIGAALRSAMDADPKNERLSRQLYDLGRAQITTIHSFCLHLLRPHAAELGLPAAFSVAQPSDVASLARQTMGDLLSACFDSGDESFFRLADTLGGARNEASLDAVMLDLAETLRAHGLDADALASLADRMEHTDSFFSSPIGSGTRVQTRRFAAHYEAYFRAAVDMFAEDEICTRAFLPMAEAHAALCRALVDACDRGDYAGVRRAFAAYNPPARLATPRKYEAPPEVEFFKKQHDAFKKECRTLREKYFAATEEEILFAAARTADIGRSAADVLRRYFDELSERKKERSIVDFGDLEVLAAQLMCAPDGSPTDAARSAGREYDYIFIDEYQDTNRTQDSIFRALAEGGGARFMVGDVKQSIYRFRGADPEVFARYRRLWPPLDPGDAHADGRSLFMQENFRCDRTVVDFVNLVSRHVFPAGSIAFSKEDELAFAKRMPEGACPIPAEICLLEREKGDDTRLLEAEYVADRIAEMLSHGHLGDGSPVRPENIAILLRSANLESAAFAEALAHRGIPVEKRSAISLYEEPEVVLMLSILRAIDNPTRDIDLAGAMKSPVFGFSLDDLIRIRRTEEAGSLWEAVRAYATGENAEDDADHDLARRCRAFADRLSALRRDARGMAADKLILRLYDDTEIHRLAEEDSERETNAVRANLRDLYDAARQFENRTQSGGLYTFLRMIEEITEEGQKDADEGTANAVRILSIHQSKGLEFPVCFLARTARKFNRQDAAAALLFDPAVGTVMRLPDESGILSCDTPLRRSVAAAVTDASTEEEMRILYVALTRARERLIVTAALPDPQSALDAAEAAAPYHTAETVYAADSPIYWVLDALAAARERGESVDCATVRIVPHEAAREDVPTSPDEASRGPQDPLPPAEMSIDDSFQAAKEQAKAIFTERFAYRYPHAHLAGIPAKLTVSRLTPSILDESEDPPRTELNRDPIAPAESGRNRAPRFLSGRTEFEASLAGTATHVFMQFCDFARLADTDAATELMRLRESGFLSAAMADAVRLDEIEKFRASALFSRIRDAAVLRREFRFNAALPACRFTRDETLAEKLRVDGTDVIVQGVVDCLFIEKSGRAVLVDYKTDRLSRRELEDPHLAAAMLCARHAHQLRYYRAVCAAMLGRPLDECLLYSLPLGDSIPVPEESDV